MEAARSAWWPGTLAWRGPWRCRADSTWTEGGTMDEPLNQAAQQERSRVRRVLEAPERLFRSAQEEPWAMPAFDLVQRCLGCTVFAADPPHYLIAEANGLDSDAAGRPLRG